MRNAVTGPLLHIKHNSLPRGARKLEFELDEEDLRRSRMTVADYSLASIKSSLLETVGLYMTLRNVLSHSSGSVGMRRAVGDQQARRIR